MSAKPTGYGLMQIGGQERPYLVGFEQADIFCRLLTRRNPETGQPMTLADYGQLFSLQAIGNKQLLPADVYEFLYSSLVSGANEDGIPVDFSPRMVSQWLADAEDEEAQKPLVEMVDQTKRRIERHIERHAKNAPAPKAKGAKAMKKA